MPCKAASSRRTSSTGAWRTRCCSKSSRIKASARSFAPDRTPRARRYDATHRVLSHRRGAMTRARTGERREIILQTLARMLQERHGERITTAELARAVGVSEAALYRHFSSKARMFEALLEFIEESLFTRISRIVEEEHEALKRIQT